MTAAHEWAKRLCALWPGDALVLPEYHICKVVSVCGQPEFVVWGNRVQLLKVVIYNEREARAELVRWLVRDGVKPADARFSREDAIALMLSAPPVDTLYLVRISRDSLSGVRRVNRKPGELHLPGTQTSRPEPVRSVPVIQFAERGMQLSLFAA